MPTQAGTYCESCMMPFAKDPMGAGRENPRYCSYCYKGGGFVYPGNDPKEFRRLTYAAMRTHMNPIKAHLFTFLTRFAPRWKKK